MKVAYNACYGGFGLSEKALSLLAKKKGTDKNLDHLERTDKDLIEVIEELGELANGMWAKLNIAEIPDGAEFEIDEYDGFEAVEPPRMSW